MSRFTRIFTRGERTAIYTALVAEASRLRGQVLESAMLAEISKEETPTETFAALRKQIDRELSFCTALYTLAAMIDRYEITAKTPLIIPEQL